MLGKLCPLPPLSRPPPLMQWFVRGRAVAQRPDSVCGLLMRLVDADPSEASDDDILQAISTSVAEFPTISPTCSSSWASELRPVLHAALRRLGPASLPELLGSLLLNGGSGGPSTSAPPQIIGRTSMSGIDVALELLGGMNPQDIDKPKVLCNKPKRTPLSYSAYTPNISSQSCQVLQPLLLLPILYDSSFFLLPPPPLAICVSPSSLAPVAIRNGPHKAKDSGNPLREVCHALHTFWRGHQKADGPRVLYLSDLVSLLSHLWRRCKVCSVLWKAASACCRPQKAGGPPSVPQLCQRLLSALLGLGEHPLERARAARLLSWSHLALGELEQAASYAEAAEAEEQPPSASTSLLHLRIVLLQGPPSPGPVSPQLMWPCGAELPRLERDRHPTPMAFPQIDSFTQVLMQGEYAGNPLPVATC